MNQDVTTGNARGWWRWPLVPVASIVAAATGSIVVITVQSTVVGLMDDYSRSGWVHLYVYPLIPALVFGYVLAGVAVHVAPTAKVAAGVSMTAIMGFILVAFTAFCWMVGVPHVEAIQTTAWSVAAIGAGIVALMDARRRKEDTGLDVHS